MEPIIRFEQVSKAYGAEPVLKDFSLDVFPGEFLTVIGRSGCGKTTALKLVNGLIAPDSGRVLVRGQDVQKTDQVKLRRHIGYAIQNVGLFPHMTVAKNIAYVPSISGLSGWKGEEGRQKAADLLHLVGLDESFPADSVSGWASPEPWRLPRRFCSWTSPSGQWMRLPESSCRTRSSASTGSGSSR